jgi:hypothetical protein
MSWIVTKAKQKTTVKDNTYEDQRDNKSKTKEQRNSKSNAKATVKAKQQSTIPKAITKQTQTREKAEQ